jgi:hypothetical protein
MTCMPDTGIVDLTEIVGDLEVPCDWGDGYKGKGIHDDPARWVIYLVSCTCGAGGVRLGCDNCKNHRMTSEDAVICRHCGEVTVPARHAYTRAERLEK